MLVLARKLGEKIDIGGGVVVTVLKVQGDKVRLGIEAPSDVSVYRREVTEAIERAEREETAAA